MKKQFNFKVLLLVFVLVLGLVVTAGCSNGTQPPADNENGAEDNDQQVEETIKWPTKPIQFIIPFGAGGDVDQVARVLAKGMEDVLKQPVVPVNKTGGGSSLAYTEVKNSPNDGYTLIWVTTSILSSSNMGTLEYDYTSFTPIAKVEDVAMPLVVRGDSQFNTFEDLVKYAKANPGKIKIGNAGNGSDAHLQAVQTAKFAGIDVIHVPLGIERRTSALLSGEVDAAVSPLPEVRTLIEAGEMKPILMPTEERISAFPDVPTMKELGYDFTHYLFRGVIGPKNLPPEIVAILENAIKTTVESQEFQDYAARSLFNPNFMNHEDFGAWLDKENENIASWLKDVDLAN